MIVSPTPLASSGLSLVPATRTVVIIPGAGECAEAWEGVAATVQAEGIACIAVDLPMHGSNPDPQPDSIEGYADWIEAFLVDRDLDNVVLAGHSMGSLIALEIAGRGNTRVVESVLMTTGSPMSVAPFLLDLAATDAPEACAFIGKYSMSAVTSDEIEARRRSHHALRLQASASLLATDLHACNNYTRAVEAAASTSVPTTVVVAEHDRMVPEKLATPIIEALDDSRIIRLAQTGHAIQDERQAEVAGILVSAAIGTASSRVTP